MEEFRDIKGYEGIYQISNLGRVKSFKLNKEKILVKSVNSGYYTVNLYKNKNQKTRRVHQLVAEAFLNHVRGLKLVIDHINHNRLDNKAINLQWVTIRENTSKDKWRLETSSKYLGVSWYKRRRTYQAQIKVNGKAKHLGYFTREIEASEAYQKELRKIEKEVSNGI